MLDEVQTMGDGVVVGATGLPESGGGAGDESDPLYDEAVRIVTETRRASISGVQRRLKIGYNRAARLIEAMEAAGMVTPPEHNGDRSVLAPPPPNATDHSPDCESTASSSGRARECASRFSFIAADWPQRIPE